MFESLTSFPLARRWRQQAYPVPAVVALIRRELVSGAGDPVARYLLIKRRAEPYAGRWALVGGKWDFGETLETAITREVREETGLETTFVALRGVVNERVAPLGPGDDGCHFLLFVCEVCAPAGTAREQSEGPLAWFSSKELGELSASRRIIPSDYAMLEHFYAAPTLPYTEADMVVGSGENTPETLVRFEPGP